MLRRIRTRKEENELWEVEVALFLTLENTIQPTTYNIPQYKGNLSDTATLTENRLSWNEMCCALDNHNKMCHTCAKEFLDSNFNQAIIDKISSFHKIATNFTYSQKLLF